MSHKTLNPFEEHEIVPDVIDVCKPSMEMEVKFPHKHSVHMGNELKPSDVASTPTVTFAGDEDKLYTLLNVDPDAPSRKTPKYRNWRHWIVTNIPGGEVTKGQEVSQYVGAGPPKGSGLHRYVFLVYEQKEKIHVKGLPSSEASFDVRDFVAKYDLGNPVAACWYTAQNH